MSAGGRGNARGGATKKREISRNLLSINLHFSVLSSRLLWLSALYVHIFRGQSVVVHASAYFLLFTVSLRSEMKGAAQTRNAPTRRFSFSLYISFPDAIMSVSEEMGRRGNGIQVKNDPPDLLGVI